MHGDTIYKLINLIIIWIGIALFINGFEKMNESGYTPPETPSGWAMGILWVTMSIVIAIMWLGFTLSALLEQQLNKTSRWTITKLVSLTLVLIFSAISATVGTYLTWKHPYRFCLLYTSPSPRDMRRSRMPSSA